jgi:hypothetical protein
MKPLGQQPTTENDMPTWPAEASGEHRAMLQTLRDALSDIFDPLSLAPLPEGSAARDPLESLLSRQIDTTLQLKGWWGIYGLRAAKGLRFGEAEVNPDDRLRAGGDVYFAAKSFPLLLPQATRIHCAHANDHLWFGFDLPGETGSLAAAPNGTIDFHLAPRTSQQRVLVDRLLARPWSAMRSATEVGPAYRALLPGGADSTDPLLDVRPPHRMMRNLLRLSSGLFDALERVQLSDKRLYWVGIPWTEPLDPGMRPFLESLRINATVFSNRLPGTLNAGLETSFIPRSKDIRGDQAVLIGRVWDSASARQLYDRRACAATTSRTYSVRTSLDRPEVIAELVWDGPVSEHISVEYEYVPLEELAPNLLKLGDSLEADGKERIDGGELLDVWQGAGPARDDRDLWRAFASGLAGRGRAVTRREIVALLTAQDYMGLNRLIDPGDISFTHRVGRIAGHAGVVPYIEILVPVQEGSLSVRDRDDAAFLLKDRLAQSGPIGQSFRIELVERRAGT